MREQRKPASRGTRAFLFPGVSNGFLGPQIDEHQKQNGRHDHRGDGHPLQANSRRGPGNVFETALQNGKQKDSHESVHSGCRLELRAVPSTQERNLLPKIGRRHVAEGSWGGRQCSGRARRSGTAQTRRGPSRSRRGAGRPQGASVSRLRERAYATRGTSPPLPCRPPPPERSEIPASDTLVAWPDSVEGRRR